jgi:hypothetical protein
MLQAVADFVLLAVACYLPFFCKKILTPYLSAYAIEKGKRLATHEDFEQILSEQKRTTAELEVLKSRISDDIWKKQKIWEQKRRIYMSLITTTTKLFEHWTLRTVHKEYGLPDPVEEIPSLYSELLRSAEDIKWAARIYLDDADLTAFLNSSEPPSSTDKKQFFRDGLSRITDAARRELGIESLSTTNH